MNGLLQRLGAEPVDLDDMASVLSQVTSASVLLVGRSGQIIGYAVQGDFPCELAAGYALAQRAVPQGYQDQLLQLREPRANEHVEAGRCLFAPEKPCPLGERVVSAIPVVGAGQRLGTLVLVRIRETFTEEDMVLAEWGAALVGLEILRVKTQEIEEEARQKAAVQVAIATLSYSELEAVQHIFEELEGSEGLLVASRIADRIGITRSVIVNALRKFESAGVIESRSLGMKGTYIKVLNHYLLDELRRMRPVPSGRDRGN
jgi:transcriptional pleiotropic repressor